jgi:hypothetical protein
VLRVARGPHNIVRRAVEFTLEHPGIDVFIGTSSEVVATLSMLARFEMDEAELLFCDDLARLPVWQRPGAAADAAELSDTAEQMGLTVSERTAHRILAGEIAPLHSVSSIATRGVDNAPTPAEPDIYRDRRGLKIHPGDLDSFRTELETAFDVIAEKYYLHLRCEPKITVGKDDIRSNSRSIGRLTEHSSRYTRRAPRQLIIAAATTLQTNLHASGSQHERTKEDWDVKSSRCRVRAIPPVAGALVE